MSEINKDLQKAINDLPDVGINWSRRLVVRFGVISLCLAVIAIFGYLAYQEYIKPALSGAPGLPRKTLQSQSKLYTNDYWGFKFQYPSFWYPLVGAFEDGNYFFASEPINFISEHSANQAILQIKTYNNIKNLSLNDWLVDQKQNYFPFGAQVLNEQPYSLGQLAGRRYDITLKKPDSLGISHWDMIVLAQNNRFYEFILETSNSANHDAFKDVFEFMVGGSSFYKPFGT